MLRHESALPGAGISTGKGTSAFIYRYSLGVRVILLFRKGQFLIVHYFKNEGFPLKSVLKHIVFGDGCLFFSAE